MFLLPMLAYIFVRNITYGLRLWHSHYLAEMGKMTLETYLMQHHIWSTALSVRSKSEFLVRP